MPQGHLCRCTGYTPIVAAALDAAARRTASAGRETCAMLDLGRSFLQASSAARDALALVDGDMRLTYAQWHRRSAVAGGIAALGLAHGDHLLVVLQNRWEMATLHWACQFAGIVITPFNWRAKADELDYCLTMRGAKAIVYEDGRPRRSRKPAAQSLPRIALDDAARRHDRFATLLADLAPGEPPRERRRLVADALHLGHHGRAQRRAAPSPAGAGRGARPCRAESVSARRAHARRDAAVSHHGRALAARDGAGRRRVRLRRRSTPAARSIQSQHERVTNLYLVPTLYHDLLTDGLRRNRHDLGAQARLRRRADDRRFAQAAHRCFRPELFVNHYGSSEVYTFTIDQTRRANRALPDGRHQPAHPRREARRAAPEELAQLARKARSSRCSSDEAFEGYWRRPDANAKALRDGWYFTGDTGYLRPRRRPVRHRPRRRHDHHRRREHLAGRDRSCCRCIPPSPRWRSRRCRTSAGAARRRLHQAPRPVDAGGARCLLPPSGLANFKRPRAMSSSTRFRNRRSARSCAASWSPASTRPIDRQERTQGTAA